MSSPDAALKLEIARLTGAIDRAKSTTGPPSRSTYPSSHTDPAASTRPRHNVYVNPYYKPHQAPRQAQAFRPSVPPADPHAPKREVVIGGVAFESSTRSLVRKDLPKPVTATPKPAQALKHDYARNSTGHLFNTARVYKPKSSSRGRRANRNMTLANGRKPFNSRRSTNKTRKYIDKPCARFTTTGTCSRGLTCPYRHNADKIAICWPFLQGNCPNSAETCSLSHDPTPNRTPLCMHFANAGRCTRAQCPYPHVRVGPRQGVCRDFAVLGYCEKGLDCEHQHVRECPDFAERGVCETKGCKLPHVIRANRNRKAAPNVDSAAMASSFASDTTPAQAPLSDSGSGEGSGDVLQSATAEGAQLGDEYISLTFHESEEESDDEEEEDDEDDDNEAAADESEPESPGTSGSLAE